MKKHILILGFAGLVLSGCSISGLTQEKEIETEKGATIEKTQEKQEDIFSKKKMCASYKDKIENLIESSCHEKYSCWLDQLQYSKNRSSCIYIKILSDRSLDGPSSMSYDLEDFFSDENLLSWYCSDDNEDRQKCENDFFIKAKKIDDSINISTFNHYINGKKIN